MARTKTTKMNKNSNGSKPSLDKRVARSMTQSEDTNWSVLKLRFTAPLIMHAFDQKAVEEMLAKQIGKPIEQEPKVPAECIERATMRNERGEVCLLPVMFKKSMLTGAAGLQMFRGLKLRSQLWIKGMSIPISWDDMVPRMDMVKVGPWHSRVADVRFRPQFNGARCTIVVETPAKMGTDTLLELVKRGGKIGVGDWRPEKGGSFGTYELEDAGATGKELDEALEQCRPVVPPLVIPEWAMHAEINPTIVARLMKEALEGEASEE